LLLASHYRAIDFLSTSAAQTAIASTPINLEGHQLGRYQLTSRLATGGMGEVYKARDTRLGRTVAIKVLPSHVAADPQAIDRFAQEARAVAALNHPHICTLHDVGEVPSLDPSGRPSIRFLVMEYVEGTTLELADGLPLEFARVVRIATQVSDALEAAHAQGVVHRDIKPANIMVTPQGRVKVLDFGVAKLERRSDPAGRDMPGLKTTPGVVVGTLSYMSPEQACGEAVTSASDIFSLGIVLYRLVTGRHPFAPGEPHARMHALVEALVASTPIAPHHFNEAVPPALEALILQMLEKDPARRPDAATIRRALLEPTILADVAPAPVRSEQRRPHTVGRQVERRLVEQAFVEAAAGRPMLVSVSGEPGIGKTTFVEEFLGRVQTENLAYVARGRCSERLSGSEAYLPILETLDSLLTGDDRHSGAQQRMMEVAPTWYAQVAPAGHGPSTGVGAQLELKTASQERMKREMRAFLADLSRTKPLVLFLDDLHWSDVSTVDLLGYLCRQFGSMRILVIVTYRPTDLLLARHPFANLRLELSARGVCRDVPLGFLSREDAARYLELQYPAHNFPSALASVIHERTEGSPLFMTDVVRDLQDRDVIVRTERGWSLLQSVPSVARDLPESVRSMIERKIAQLGDDDRRLLVCASVQGHSFDSAVVAKSLGRDPVDVEERLEILDRVHTFVSVRGEDVLPAGIPTMRCRFVHVLYQNALYTSLGATRRSSLSATVADVLIEYYGGENTGIASELAVLLEAARDHARAARYFLIASQNALRVFAFVEAAAIAGRGLALLSGLPPSTDRNAVELKLQIALGTAAVAIKGYAAPEVERAYGRARELCRQIDHSAELASVLFGLHVYYVVVPSHQTSLELGDEMLALADREDDETVRVQALLTKGMARVWMGDVDVAHRLLEEGIARYDARRVSIAGTTPLFDHGAGCRRYQGVALWMLGYPDSAVRLAREAVADARSLKHPLTIASTLSFESMLYYFRRDIPAAARAAAEAVTCTREYVLTFWHGFSSALNGWATAQIAMAAGNLSGWEDGIAQIRESLEAHREAGARTFGSIGRALLAETYMLRERFEEAGTALDEGLDLARQVEEGIWESELHRLQGELSLRRGSRSAAVQHFEQAIEVARTRKQKTLELRGLTSLYRLMRLNTDPTADQVREELARARETFTEGSDTADLRQADSLLERSEGTRSATR
jgi:tetratricopeptide (TPR) repeat protein